jgi:hypothetical protein
MRKEKDKRNHWKRTFCKSSSPDEVLDVAWCKSMHGELRASYFYTLVLVLVFVLVCFRETVNYNNVASRSIVSVVY